MSESNERTGSTWQLEPTGPIPTLHLGGIWRLEHSLPTPEIIVGQAKSLKVDASGVTEWDTGLVAFLFTLNRMLVERGGGLDPRGLPPGADRLYRLATTLPPAALAAKPELGFVGRTGRATLELWSGCRDMVSFMGEAAAAFAVFLSGRARFRRQDLWVTIQQCGADALPIVSLISVLVGLILGYVGVVQLTHFGAGIFVANLVGIAMARDIGPIMTGIIMAGRTGASFAAQLGSMQVNEEVDALRTLGVPPIEFLVLPRMLALILMMPLLTIYADALGIVGGGIVGVMLPDVSLTQYVHQTLRALSLSHFMGGLLKSIVYGALVALAGCLRGMRSGRSAAAVGEATTSAVVTAIVSMVAACAILTVVYNVLGV
jgi:phospholipid/cholesterol/gamma-HCH transport system permease protein